MILIDRTSNRSAKSATAELLRARHGADRPAADRLGIDTVERLEEFDWWRRGNSSSCCAAWQVGDAHRRLRGERDRRTRRVAVRPFEYLDPHAFDDKSCLRAVRGAQREDGTVSDAQVDVPLQPAPLRAPTTSSRHRRRRLRLRVLGTIGNVVAHGGSRRTAASAHPSRPPDGAAVQHGRRHAGVRSLLRALARRLASDGRAAVSDELLRKIELVTKEKWV